MKGYINNKRIEKQIQFERGHEEYLVMNSVPANVRKPLTDQEKQAAIDLWGKAVPAPYSWKEFEVYKFFNGFDARFMPMSFYLPWITRRLNDYEYAPIFEHKSLLGYLTKGPIRFPHSFVKAVAGDLYSSDMHQISEEEAVEACLKEDKLVVKDSVGGSGGKGIEILKMGGVTLGQRKKIILNAIRHRAGNFVIQEFLHEHETLQRFNSSSVNTIRIQTLYLNGKCTAVTTILRMGGDGAEVDNACSGGISVGIHPDGRLYEFGYDNQTNQYRGKKGIVFKDTVIDQIPNLINTAIEAHVNEFPLCKYIGWDFIIDKDDNPICIELNSCQNGHLIFQLSAGPTFGERTQEVIDYCKDKPFTYKQTSFSNTPR